MTWRGPCSIVANSRLCGRAGITDWRLQRRPLGSQGVVWSRLKRCVQKGVRKKVCLRRTDHVPQRFHEGVAIWKVLHHQNVLALLGVTTTGDQFTTVSEWMTNGNVNEFIKAHPDANLLKLVCFPFGSLSFPDVDAWRSPCSLQMLQRG